MQDLTLVGLSEDGRRLLLRGPSGKEYAVALDARLRAVLRGDHARSGQLEMKMESALRPRDIQARIRAGETPEAVAEAAGTTVEAIMSFAGPVIAERQHVAQTALKASVRRRSGESSSAGRTLGEAAELYFADHSLHDEDVEWDAWRGPDGRWSLVVTYAVAGRPRTAEFTHDLPGRYVVALNDEARLLTGELREPESREPAAGRSQARRLSSVPSQDELPLGDDAIELVREPEADEPTELVDAEPDQPPVEVDDQTPASVPQPSAAQSPQSPEAEAVETDGVPTDGAPTDGAPPEVVVVAKKKSRSSVPSWDEIMFGGKDE